MTISNFDAQIKNQKLWDELAPVHLKAYPEVNTLRNGGITLHRTELDALGSVAGKSLLHLQCHIGTDTLSWARQGADVTGVDFSGESIRIAGELQQELGIRAEFIHSNIYDLPQVLDQHYDVVYTSRGVLCWLSDIHAWAELVARYLKPGGIFYIMETHPVVGVFDDVRRGSLQIQYSYFHSSEPMVWDDDGPDYADENFVPANPSFEWTWSLSDIMNALLKAGLRITDFRELDQMFYKGFPDMTETERGWFHHCFHPGLLPLTFTLTAEKPESV